VRTRKHIWSALALVTALGGGLAAYPTLEASAQTAAPPSAAQPQRPPRPPRDPARHVEGRIAYLKAELHITPTQEPQWQKVADVIRQNAQQMRRDFEQRRANPSAAPNAVSRLEMRARFSAERSQATERLLAAFRPLYDTMSPEQKVAADHMMAPRWHGHRHGRA
jgi:protein CpxP